MNTTSQSPQKGTDTKKILSIAGHTLLSTERDDIPLVELVRTLKQLEAYEEDAPWDSLEGTLMG